MKVFVASLAAVAVLCAQEPNPTQRAASPGNQDGNVPLFRVNVVSRTAQAINYRHRGGATKVNFQGTALMPRAEGDAKVESERGVIHVDAHFKKLQSASTFGPEYLTYVLWAISPEGKPVAVGEVLLDNYGNGDDSKISATVPLQAFGMIVTAEPYFAVSQPSDVVVLENLVRNDTQGVVENINAKYELLPRGIYTQNGNAKGFTPIVVSKKLPLELFEAQNAIQLARIAGADKYATDSFQNATGKLAQADKYQAQKAGQKPVITMARDAVQTAEDARVIALRRQVQEAQDREKQAALDRENAAKAQAEAEAARAQQANQQRMAAEQATAAAQQASLTAQQERLAAERAKAEAEQARQQAEQARQQAEQARQQAQAAQQQALSEADRAKQQASEADRLRQQAEADRANMRAQLLRQLNLILETRDSARGLIVNMSDVLFDTGKYTLKPGAREKLSKVAGIVQAYPGLNLQVEGHTDSVGSDELNMRLSQQRAAAVQTYLTSQGVPATSITAQGFGKANPVASNDTAAGRQQNRRVEMVVSGDVIGQQISSQMQQGTVPAVVVPKP